MDSPTPADPALAPGLNTVPPELAGLILAHARWLCTREELARIALASRYLHAVAAPALYHTVIADDERFLLAVHSALKRDPSKGQHVRHLVLPRHRSVAAQVAGSDEWLRLRDALCAVLRACGRLVSLEFVPISEEVVDAVPWASLKRLSVGAQSAQMYQAVFERCGAVEHLNLLDLRTIVREFSFFHALFGPPDPPPAQEAGAPPPADVPSSTQRRHAFDALKLVSAEWSDPQQHEDGPPVDRAVELVRFFCALPSTRKVLVLLTAHWGFARAESPRATHTWELMRPLKSPKVFVALHARLYELWVLDLDQTESYEAMGERVWSEDDV